MSFYMRSRSHFRRPNGRRLYLTFMAESIGVPVPIAIASGGGNINFLGTYAKTTYIETSKTTISLSLPSGIAFAYVMLCHIGWCGEAIVPVNGTYIIFPYRNITGVNNDASVSIAIATNGTCTIYNSNYSFSSVYIHFLYYGTAS